MRLRVSVMVCLPFVCMCPAVRVLKAHQLLHQPPAHRMLHTLPLSCAWPVSHSRMPELSWPACCHIIVPPSVQVEMYADPIARGGVLEPEGIVEIKFRVPDLLKAMHRLDPVIRGLKDEVEPDWEAQIKARETALLPVYRQVCSPFLQYPEAEGAKLAGFLAEVMQIVRT